MKNHVSAARLLLVVSLAIFAAETIIMLFLRETLSGAGPLPGALLDSLMLIALIFPALYLIFYRPMSRSIKERISAERELDRHRNRLESMVARRTAELEEARDELRDRYEEIMKVDRVKDALLHDIAHELKTPVAKHFMIADILENMLREQKLPDRVFAALDDMRANLRRQRNSVRSILMLAHMEKGDRTPFLSPIRVDRVLSDVLTDYGTVMSHCGIQLETDLKELTATSDRDLLWHVFSNLIDNAIKFRRADAPCVRIRGKRENGSVRVRIEDNGTGISREDRGKVFDRFYQASACTEGVGVGLALSRMILTKLGGDISIESEGRHRGAAAVVSLPAGPPQPKEATAPESGPAAVRHSPQIP
jgi:signal transduction histidine kinase